MKIMLVLLLLAWQDDPKPLKVGDKAPDFKIKNHDGKNFELLKAAKKGWLVLAFYPKAHTPG